MSTKYSIFISSTFEDLKEERQAVQEAVIVSGDFPVQMEAFPAADDEAFELIKSLLAQCDYYILIIGGRYGTLADDGLSFTHKEFRYAVSQNIPVLVMLHGDRGQITADKIERSDEGKLKLAAFIEEVSKGRTRKEWTTKGDLKASVFAALANAKLTKPRVGWVRADTVASVEALGEINELRKQNADYRDALGSFEIEIPHIPLPAGDAATEIDFLGNKPTRRQGYGSHGTISTSWMALFPIIHANLNWGDDNFETGHWINETDSCEAIGSALVQEVMEGDAGKYFKISPGTFRKMMAYFIEAGLMMPTDHSRPFTEQAERFARRQHFASAHPQFTLVRGKAVVTYPSSEPSENGLDDDIPF
ncbi:MAG: DUF4062 domain-containing protein [Devosia sp.]